MNLLFSFLNLDRPHSASIAGYFSKVCPCYTRFPYSDSSCAPLASYFQLVLFMCYIGGHVPHAAEDSSNNELCSGE